MSEYITKKKFKYNGRVYQQGEPIDLDGIWDDKLIGTYVLRVDEKQSDDVEQSKRRRYASRGGLSPAKALDISAAAQEMINATGLDVRKVAQAADTNRITKPIVQQYIKETEHE